MRELPILFSAPMVRALLEGRKTVTRRIVKPQPLAGHSFAGWCIASTKRIEEGDAVWSGGDQSVRLTAPHRVRCPYGQPGDRLWVRETFVTGWTCSGDGIPMQFDEDGNELPAKVWYRATRPDLHWVDDDGSLTDSVPWKPSIHMPRWASRITLEVTGVHVERLQDITEEQARAEGASFHDGRGIGHSGWRHDLGDVHANARSSFARLWESINGTGSWDANPWVWAVEFKRIKQERKAA